MSARRGRIATIVIAGLLLLAGSALGSYAANGGPLLLGKGNTATKTTKLKTTGNGAALNLKSKAGNAPLKVSNSTQVANLNADLLDGADISALRTRTWSYTLSGTSGANVLRFALPGLPAGRYHASYSVNATTSGGASSFACVFDSGVFGANPRLTNYGVADGTIFFVSASGLLDTTQRAYTLSCAANAGSLTIPASGVVAPAVVTLTRVDDVTEAASIGATSRDR